RQPGVRRGPGAAMNQICSSRHHVLLCADSSPGSASMRRLRSTQPNIWRAAPSRRIAQHQNQLGLARGNGRRLHLSSERASLSMPRWAKTATRDQLYERTAFAMATDEPTLSVALTPPSPTVAGSERRLECHFSPGVSVEPPANTCAQASVSCYCWTSGGHSCASKREPSRMFGQCLFDWGQLRCGGEALINAEAVLQRSIPMTINQCAIGGWKSPERLHSLLNPLKAIAQLVAWILLEGFLSYSLLQANSTALAAVRHQLNNISCSLALLPPHLRPCISDIYVKQVSKTNLVFVAVALDTGCQCQLPAPAPGQRRWKRRLIILCSRCFAANLLDPETEHCADGESGGPMYSILDIHRAARLTAEPPGQEQGQGDNEQQGVADEADDEPTE
uniref:EGF-like domain-containing protein n=1 Tax=Macrostomum lignano TaxID=282301 RepID=A0A1I8F814_9PLAT